ncbi:sulfatase-like hydrolase/transferase [Parapedobacter sp. DT-150]|uniref:sulfatase-like hydrolase/transferase n=1 Tax=Parapedobacter sp. DT-150 TaxID=3396162 RepID=UPI003F1D275C
MKCLLILTALVGPSALAYSQPDRPNILWIVSEDNSPFLGCYGDTFAATPRLDRLASEGVLYERAFSAAPVCAPSRSTLITGVYPTAMGTEHMRSQYPIPELIRLFPEYLRKAGYYTTNNAKTDYNLSPLAGRMDAAWDESSNTATYKNRKPGQPFFAVFNTNISHESSIHKPLDTLMHDPRKAPIPPYHPRTAEMEHDWAQYYDRITQMDTWVGGILDALEQEGLAENTIVFYYSDHGGVLGRSKRFLYDSGLHIPLIIRFPKKYAHLAPGGAGTHADRVVSFVDFAPTVLGLAGVPVPEYMQGHAFLGERAEAPPAYAFAFRGRMDERIDLSRTVRDARYRYTRNFMPHKIYGQYIEYLWQAPSMPSWEHAYQEGRLNAVQSAFWEPKPFEELYDTEADPHNIHNLALNPAYRQVVDSLREAMETWILAAKDVGFIPESMMADISETTPLYAFARDGDYPLERILETASMAASGQTGNLPALTTKLQDKNPVVRYWAATGCRILGGDAAAAKPDLVSLLEDSVAAVRIAVAEALYYLGEKERAVSALTDALADRNRMARVQALNVLQTVQHDALPALEAAQRLVASHPKGNDYDIRAARGLIKTLEQ